MVPEGCCGALGNPRGTWAACQLENQKNSENIEEFQQKKVRKSSFDFELDSKKDGTSEGG